MVNITKHFKTFKSGVIEGKDAYAVAREMLEKRINEMAVLYREKLYLLNLPKILKIVS